MWIYVLYLETAYIVHTCTHSPTLALSDFRGLRSAYMYTHAFLLLHSSPPTALAEPLSQLVITALPPRSPLALSCCTLTICGNWLGLGLKRHVTHTTGDPRSWGHTSTAKIQRTHTYTYTHTSHDSHNCNGHEMSRWREQKEIQAIYCAFGHRQKRWDYRQNVPGRKCTEKRVTFRNKCWECFSEQVSAKRSETKKGLQ